MDKYLGFAESTVIDLSPSQLANVIPPMLVTLDGIVTDVRPRQSANAFAPTRVTPSETVTDAEHVPFIP